MKEITLEQKNSIYIDLITDESIVGVSCYNTILKRNDKFFCISVESDRIPFTKEFYALDYKNLYSFNCNPKFPNLKSLINNMNYYSTKINTYKFFIFDSTKELFNWLNE